MLQKMMVAVVLAGAASGCATVTRGTTEAFVVETEPAGAHVSLSNGQTCDATPCTFPKMKRDSEFAVTITKPGYKTATTTVTHQTSGGGGAGMAGNLILGGVIGAVVDANNGATQELVPNPLRITMELDQPALAAAPVGAAAAVAAAPAGAAAAAPAAPAQP